MDGGDLAKRICATLRQNGHRALLAGGCVRDLRLGRPPADYDIATDARPERVLELFPGSLSVGAQFGVVVVVESGLQVEVATFRADGTYSDGRHPDAVTFSQDPAEDARRRDFTINGLLMDPETQEVLDFVGGQQDLESRVIRAIGDPERRFREDKLRLVRAVRFAARLGYNIQPATFAALRALSPEAAQVSAERLRDELTKILTEGSARRGFEMLEESGLLQALLPEVARMRGVEQPPQFHPEGDVWIHTRLLLEGLARGCSPTLAWGVLLHDVGKPPTFSPPRGPEGRIRFDQHVEVGARMAEVICQRYRFSSEDSDQVVALVANHLRFKDAGQMKLSTLKRFVRLTRFEEHMELHRLDCLASHGQMEAYEFVSKFLTETPPEVVRPARLITGNDLSQLGFRPGPVFREILQAVEDAQLEGRVVNRAQALDYVRSRFPSGALNATPGEGQAT